MTGMTADLDALRQAYEEIPYQGVADPESFVGCLHAVARLHGIPAAAAGACRVLELGCASGHNLIPQAIAYPGSRFLGVDFSRAQVALGRETIDHLGLRNIELRDASIDQVDASWGQFDYILCLGVFSWVAPALQAQLLAICRQNLAPHGAALVSFNAYPGWHHRAMLRDLLRYHVAPFPNCRRQISEARTLLEFVAEHSSAASVQGRTFRTERDRLRSARDDYLFHEYLVADNHPRYLHEFVAGAEAAGLQFVTDAELWRMSGAFMPPAIQTVLGNTPLVQRCQFLDFLRNETFHKTVLCHRDKPVRHDWGIDDLTAFFVALVQKPKPVSLAVVEAAPVTVEFPIGALTVGQPLGKAAIQHLIDVFPAAVSLDQLHGGALSLLPPDLRRQAEAAGDSRQLLAGSMLDAARAGLLRFYADPPIFCDHVSSRPCVSPLTRCLAPRGDIVISQRHDNVKLDPLQTFLAPRLDGTRTVADLVEAVQRAVADGALTWPEENPLTAEVVEAALSQLGRAILLVG